MLHKLLKGLRIGFRRAGLFLFVVFVSVSIWQLLVHPRTPLPRSWNPARPLNVKDQYTPITDWKLRRALASPASCLAALATGAAARAMPDKDVSEECHIHNRVTLSRIGSAGLRPVETTCETALRLTMWMAHGVQLAAESNFGQAVTELRHFSSYNCRAMRTSAGETRRMSTHATASAIDVSGFVVEGVGLIDLKKHWSGGGAKASFLRDANEAACMWFRVTLGPRYNRLHADHFHLQGQGWGLCR